MFGIGKAMGAIALLMLASGCPRPAVPERAAPMSKPEPEVSAEADHPLEEILPRYHALVIGINDYHHSRKPHWSDLRTARNDAVAIAEVLRTGYAFDVTTLLDREATRANIMASLTEIMSLGSNDAAIVYFAGHGYLDEGMDEGHWIPSDARFKEQDRLVTEDWLWNSTVTKMVAASELRHVLIIADACFSGSLFRGAEPMDARRRELRFYERAIEMPSRYLLTSGNMEPVLDSGGKHSVFAQQLLNTLKYPKKAVFSVTEVGVAIQGPVASGTRQLPRVGRLNVPSHAGGEFVFVHRTDMPGAVVKAEIQEADMAPELLEQIPESVSDIETNRIAESASALIDKLTEQYGEDSEASRLVASYLATQRRVHKVSELYDLLQQLHTRTRGKTPTPSSITVRPRILACLGPTLKGDTKTRVPPIVMRIGIQNELASLGGCVVVEREAVESALRELAVSTTQHVDVEAEAGTGKLLPASLLLVGEMVSLGDADEIYMRIVDTSSLRVVASTSQRIAGTEDVQTAVSTLGKWAIERIREYRPFECAIMDVAGDSNEIPIGRFHGLTSGTAFDIVSREDLDSDSVRAPKEMTLGRATITNLTDRSSVLTLEWDDAAHTNSVGWLVLVREMVGG
jgi:hypothetical protein